RAKLILTRSGAARALLANVVTAFREAPQWKGLHWFDAFRQTVWLHGQPPWCQDPEHREWTAADDLRAANWLQHEGIAIGPDIVAQAVELVGRDRTFHPVLDYLESCRWDGAPRIDTWTVDFLGATDTPFVRAVSAR